jgi:MFS family permease
MQNVGAAWLMSSVTASPMMVALIQSATSFPAFLLALPAGALADIVDRRRLLLFTQGWMLLAACLLGVLTFAGMSTSWILLALTFAIGVGAAMNSPAWQATLPEMVPPRDLRPAVALNAISANLARAVGPALAGFVIAAVGAGVVFLLNALSFLGVVLVLYRWRPVRPGSKLPAEHTLGAMRAGLRYVRYAQPLRAVLWRTAAFIIFGSTLWALLPVLSRNLGFGSTGYGLLLGCFGAGAVAGGMSLPKVRQKQSTDSLLGAAIVLLAAVNLSLAYVRSFSGLCLVMAMGGLAWIVIMSSLNAAAQTTVPAWVRARALAVYQLVFQGGVAFGSALWGAVASKFDLRTAFMASGIGLILGLVLTSRFRLQAGEALDLTPSVHWPEPTIVIEHLQDAHVLVTVEYRIDPKQASEFALAMEALKVIRLRDGGMSWGLYQDSADPSRVVESFVVESWAEHQRQHERVTQTDLAVEEAVRSFHHGERPKVSHLVQMTEYRKPNHSFRLPTTKSSDSEADNIRPESR